MRAATLSILLLSAAGGCAGFGPSPEEDYSRTRRSIEGDYAVQPASYEGASDEIVEEEQNLRWSDFSPANATKTVKRLAGQGPDPTEAKELYRQAESLYQQASQSKDADQLKEAAGLYHAAARKWPDSALEQDALFMAGESYFFADAYVEANETLEQLLARYPQTRHMDTVQSRRFAIAEYWLGLDQADPQRWYEVNLTERDERPTYDQRGHALRVFDKLRLEDPTGRLADDATLALGNAHFAAGSYVKADEYYTDLRKTFPASEHQFRAHFLGVKAKIESYRGPEYSRDPLDEAEKLIKKMRLQFPAESREEDEFLKRAYAEVRYKQAERQWRMARYFDRRRQYGSARLHFENILQEYGDTPFAERAQARMEQIAERPANPPQRLTWLVEMFADPSQEDDIKPVSEGVMRR